MCTIVEVHFDTEAEVLSRDENKFIRFSLYNDKV